MYIKFYNKANIQDCLFFWGCAMVKIFTIIFHIFCSKNPLFLSFMQVFTPGVLQCCEALLIKGFAFYSPLKFYLIAFYILCVFHISTNKNHESNTRIKMKTE